MRGNPEQKEKEERGALLVGMTPVLQADLQIGLVNGPTNYISPVNGPRKYEGDPDKFQG